MRRESPKPRKPKRRRFKFRPVPKPPVDVHKLAVDLTEAARGLDEASRHLAASYQALRSAVGDVAEMDVSDWDIEQVLRYAEGVIKTRTE